MKKPTIKKPAATVKKAVATTKKTATAVKPSGITLGEAAQFAAAKATVAFLRKKYPSLK